MIASPPLDVAGIRWQTVAGANRDDLATQLQHALKLIAEGAVPDLKTGRRKQLFALALGPEGCTDHLLKVNRYRPLRGYLRPRSSKARRELRIAVGLEARGIPVVVPVAAGELRKRGRLLSCYLLVPWVPGARDLASIADDPGISAGRRRALAAALGSLTRRAHEAGLFQDDLAPNNVLVEQAAGNASLRLVDFERARLRRRISGRARRWMLAKLVRALPGASSAQRLRFLRAYCVGDTAATRRWWQALARFAPRLAARDAARMRRTSTTDGRRFYRVRVPEGWGFARREASAAGALTAAQRAAPSQRPGEVRPGARHWEIHYPGSSGRSVRALWARANLLHARGLAPLPLVVLARPAGVVLVLARPAGLESLKRGRPLSRSERAAAGRLLARLLELGRLRPGLRAESIAFDPTGRPRAALLAPHAFRFSRRGADASSRRRAARLLEREATWSTHPVSPS